MDKDEATQVLSAAVLSDWNLCLNGRNAHLQTALADNKDNFVQREQIPDRDLLQFLQHFTTEILGPLGIEPCAGHPRIEPHLAKAKDGRWLSGIRLTTLNYELLTELYFVYYPGNVKTVPENFVLTNLFLAWFFMFDGNSQWHTSGTPAVRVLLCTQGFDLHSIELFEHQLHKLGINTGRKHARTKSGLGIMIAIQQDSVDRFMSMVDPYVIPPFRYKIKYRGSCPLELAERYRESYSRQLRECRKRNREHINKRMREWYRKRNRGKIGEEEVTQGQQLFDDLRVRLKGG